MSRPAPSGPPIHDNATGRRPGSWAAAGRNSPTPPEGSVLVGFEVGLGKWGNSDVVHAIRPIFRTAAGHETFGKQHGTDTSRVIVVKAKRGYAVGSITAKSMALLDGFSVTFMELVAVAPGFQEELSERVDRRQGRQPGDHSRRRWHAGDRHRRPRKREGLHRNGIIAETVGTSLRRRTTS